mmetsp:Transcript_28806/g.48907  ORF Transcript_28806/g.48907 Transcript_28806/m.48907 type:complete len:207 (-) Transcript_28806:420-1040(-)
MIVQACLLHPRFPETPRPSGYFLLRKLKSIETRIRKRVSLGKLNKLTRRRRATFTFKSDVAQDRSQRRVIMNGEQRDLPDSFEQMNEGDSVLRLDSFISGHDLKHYQRHLWVIDREFTLGLTAKFGKYVVSLFVAYRFEVENYGVMIFPIRLDAMQTNRTPQRRPVGAITIIYRWGIEHASKHRPNRHLYCVWIIVYFSISKVWRL